MAAERDGLTGVSATRAAIGEVGAETQAIRARLNADDLIGTLGVIDLGAPGFLPAGYEAGNVAAIAYDPRQLPSNAVLASDYSDLLSFTPNA
jgi:hypothetical protein